MPKRSGPVRKKTVKTTEPKRTPGKAEGEDDETGGGDSRIRENKLVEEPGRTPGRAEG